MIRLIAAIDQKRGIAKNDSMPWDIPDDEQYFTDETKKYGGYVLTGGKTFRSAYKGKPLAGRNNYILTRDNTPIQGVELVHDLPKFLESFNDKDLWVAGGSEVFEQVIKLNKADILYLTHIYDDFDCDQFFPEYGGVFKLETISEKRHQNGFVFAYAKYSK